ncbi:MAG: VOC family protein [Chitinophagaceae bacterium]|nr:VOC family protein [Chitinophagaceae bacterium]
MISATIYLNFNGTCEAAFNHYKNVLGSDFSMLMRFNQMPPEEGQPALSEEEGNKIMHVSLPVGEHTSIMGSDIGGPWTEYYKEGSNFQINLNIDTKEEANRIFAGLSENGHVNMPLADTFWGSYFGMCTDAYGINWMINVDQEQPSQS